MNDIPEGFLRIVWYATQRMQEDGIEGWGLHTVGDETEALFDVIRVGPSTGCTDPACMHWGHSEAAETLRFVAKEGRLVHVGGEELIGKVQLDYYFLMREGQPPLGLLRREIKGFHAYVTTVRPKDVPLWVWAKLGEEPPKEEE